MKRVKQETARRQVSFRSLVIDALEKALENEPKPFVLREAAAGFKSKKGEGLSSDQVNEAIGRLHDPKP